MHNFCCTFIFLKYCVFSIAVEVQAMGAPRGNKSLPLQVAAVCFRRRAGETEFLLVNTNGGNKWTFPKGSTEARLSHSQAAQQEAFEEAGAIGVIEPRHFHLYIHSKGVFWQPNGVQEYVVKAFLMEVTRTQRSLEPARNPTWFSPEEARKVLSKGREVKYAAEMRTVIDRALAHLEASHMVPPASDRPLRADASS
jgi:8-oxo-dGTP pyrophosphatase MutT (NUDIX family)